MESARQGVNYLSEKVQGASHGVSKRTNKEIAKDRNAPLSTRASAAKDALGDKMQESTHKNKAEAHKQYAKA